MTSSLKWAIARRQNTFHINVGKIQISIKNCVTRFSKASKLHIRNITDMRSVEKLKNLNLARWWDEVKVPGGISFNSSWYT